MTSNALAAACSPELMVRERLRLHGRMVLRTCCAFCCAEPSHSTIFGTQGISRNLVSAANGSPSVH